MSIDTADSESAPGRHKSKKAELTATSCGSVCASKSSRVATRRLAVYETLMTRTDQRARTRRSNGQAGRRNKMENWKKFVLAGSAGLAAILLLKGSRTGGLLFSGVALAALASEYPDTFAEIREELPNYIERGTTLLKVASRIGERFADVAESRGSAWYEALLSN